MSKSSIAILVYVAGLLFGALILDLWNSETGPKAFLGIFWTAALLISLLYTDKYDQK